MNILYNVLSLAWMVWSGFSTGAFTALVVLTLYKRWKERK